MKLIKTKDVSTIRMILSHPDTSSEIIEYVIQCDSVYEFLGSNNDNYINEIVTTLKKEWKQNHSYFHNMKLEHICIYNNEVFTTVIYDSNEE